MGTLEKHSTGPEHVVVSDEERVAWGRLRLSCRFNSAPPRAWCTLSERKAQTFPPALSGTASILQQEPSPNCAAKWKTTAFLSQFMGNEKSFHSAHGTFHKLRYSIYTAILLEENTSGIFLKVLARLPRFSLQFLSVIRIKKNPFKMKRFL